MNWCGIHSALVPGAVIQAMACRAAVVATECSGTTEVVTPGEDGVLVPVGNPAAMSEAIVRLLDAPAERARLGERAHTSARRFSVASSLPRYAAAIRGDGPESIQEAR